MTPGPARPRDPGRPRRLPVACHAISAAAVSGPIRGKSISRRVAAVSLARAINSMSKVAMCASRASHSPRISSSKQQIRGLIALSSDTKISGRKRAMVLRHFAKTRPPSSRIARIWLINVVRRPTSRSRIR